MMSTTETITVIEGIRKVVESKYREALRSTKDEGEVLKLERYLLALDSALYELTVSQRP